MNFACTIILILVLLNLFENDVHACHDDDYWYSSDLNNGIDGIDYYDYYSNYKYGSYWYDDLISQNTLLNDETNNSDSQNHIENKEEVDNSGKDSAASLILDCIESLFSLIESLYTIDQTLKIDERKLVIPEHKHLRFRKI